MARWWQSSKLQQIRSFFAEDSQSKGFQGLQRDYHSRSPWKLGAQGHVCTMAMHFPQGKRTEEWASWKKAKRSQHWKPLNHLTQAYEVTVGRLHWLFKASSHLFSFSFFSLFSIIFKSFKIFRKVERRVQITPIYPVFIFPTVKFFPMFALSFSPSPFSLSPSLSLALPLSLSPHPFSPFFSWTFLR